MAATAGTLGPAGQTLGPRWEWDQTPARETVCMAREDGCACRCTERRNCLPHAMGTESYIRLSRNRLPRQSSLWGMLMEQTQHQLGSRGLVGLDCQASISHVKCQAKQGKALSTLQFCPLKGQSLMAGPSGSSGKVSSHSLCMPSK